MAKVFTMRRAALVAVCAAAAAVPSVGGTGDEWSPPRRVHTKAALAGSHCEASAEAQLCEGTAALRLQAGRPCAVDRVPWGSLSTAEFAERYVSTGRPLILTDASAGFIRRPADWDTKRGFVAAFGGLDVNVGTGAELAQFGGKNLFENPTLTLAEVIAGFEQAEGDAGDNGRAVFDMRVTRQPALADSFTQPELFSKTFMGIKGASWNMLSLGGDGSGLGFHTHADTWLGLAAGAKRWLLFEPGSIPADDPLFPNRMLDAQQLLESWPNSSTAGEVDTPMDCMQRAGEILYLPAGYAHATYNLGETVGIGGQTQTCEASAGCKRLIKRLEGAMDNRTTGGGGSKLDPEALRLISHAHLLLGQGGKDRSHETQVMWCIESAFRLAPTMMGVAADILNIFVKGRDVLVKRKDNSAGLTRKQRSSLKAQRAAEVATARSDGYKVLHPALTLVERTIIPVLEESARAGVVPFTLAASYWATAEVLVKLVESKGSELRVRDAASTAAKRLLEAGWEMDRLDIRFPRELAVRRGRDEDFDAMRGYLDKALEIDPADPGASKMRKLLPG